MDPNTTTVPGAGHVFEEELRVPPPRRRPPDLPDGFHVLRLKRVQWSLLVSALACVGAARFDAVRELGLYFLPLAWLGEIGILLFVLALVAIVRQHFVKGPWRHFEEGTPVVARILGLELRPTRQVHGQPAGFRFVATIDVDSAALGGRRTLEVASRELSAFEKRDDLTTSWRVGDRATALYLPQDPLGTVQLYGFLDLRPGLGVVCRDGRPAASPARAALLVAAFLAFAAVMGFVVHALRRCDPLDWTTATIGPPFAASAVVLGGALLLAIDRAWRREVKQRAEIHRAALARGEAAEREALAPSGWLNQRSVVMRAVIVAGILVLGGVAGVAVALLVNAHGDEAVAELRPVEIEGLDEVTSHVLLRDYVVTYHFADEPETRREMSVTPGEMNELEPGPALAEIHSGRLHWAWIRRLLPARTDTQP